MSKKARGKLKFYSQCMIVCKNIRGVETDILQTARALRTYYVKWLLLVTSDR